MPYDTVTLLQYIYMGYTLPGQRDGGTRTEGGRKGGRGGVRDLLYTRFISTLLR